MLQQLISFPETDFNVPVISVYIYELHNGLITHHFQHILCFGFQLYSWRKRIIQVLIKLEWNYNQLLLDIFIFHLQMETGGQLFTI